MINIHISERELQLPDAVIGKLLGIATTRKDIISISAGEPDFKTPKPILDYGKKVISSSTHYSHPKGVPELREALIKKLKAYNKIKTSPENIIVTTGSQEAIITSLLCALDPGEQVVIPNPGYLAYIPAVELVSAQPVYVKLLEEENFELNPDRIKEAIDRKKTKAIIINTPSNPTGTVLSKKILEEIADIAVQYDLYVFSDEAYEKLIYEDKKHISIGSLNGIQDHVASFYSFSKTYAMCGFRVGYCVGPRELIDAMEKTHHYITLTAPHISQLMAIKSLSISNSYIEKMKNEYNRRRKMIVKRLNDLNLVTKTPYGAFYTFSNIQNYSKNSFKFASDLLKKAKVAVVPGTEFGKYGEGYIRCSYATDYHLIEKAMDRIETYLKKL
ncbi:MAG: pyridoxal phosphate-dependent aminotransferase [Candidatus Woesearchaeota archaeon]|nr:MAG: pyridoxal phosphate-dependent aminotransferase [Candidatus Woesearchaeota archaeon]